jgi:tetratricopeptide (TPR) repeat protein
VGEGLRRDPLADAERAAELAHADPSAARVLAEDALAAAVGEGDDEARATALWALGLSARELDDLDGAHARFAEAVAVADRAGLAGRAARARLSWSLVLVYRGDTDGALAALARARPALTGVETGHCDVQRALIMTRLGRLDDALADAARALPILRRHGDRLAEARLLSNLGVLRVYRGELSTALAELARAEELATELGQTLLLARTVHNQAFVLGRRGDVPRSLARYDDAEALYRRLEDPDPHLAVLDADRAEVLLGAGLAAEARQRAEASLAAQERSENVTDRAEVLLLVARARLAAADGTGAAAAASRAAASFRHQQRSSWAAMADHVAIEATPAGGRDLADRAAAVAGDLAAAGWRQAAQRARVVAARCLLEAGDEAQAGALLEQVVARHGPMTAGERAGAWHAAGLLRHVRGDRRGARRAVAAGLRVVDDHRGTLGATELRAHAAAAGSDLAELGLRLALEGGGPREVLRAMESQRAVSVLLPPVRPPDDAELADELAQLRAAEAERWSASDPAVAGAAAARVRTLELAVARRTRRVTDEGGSSPGPAALDALLDGLGGRALLEYAVLDGDVLGVVAAGGRVRLRWLGPVAAIEREASSVLASLHRMARTGVSAASTALAGQALEHALEVLAVALVTPFAGALGDRDVVVVPAGALRRVPWAAVPGLAGRPTSVAPSASSWLRAAARRAPELDGRSVLLAAGPGLDEADGEVDDLAAVHPGAVVLRSPTSTARAVLDGLAGAGLAHVAAHGAFRADNPLFSSLRLADGPLTVHELARLPRCPAWFVLSACDAAVHTSPAGDEILGLGAGLLSLGAADLVAPLAPVPDGATRPFVGALHRRLRAGDRPAAALARLQEPVAGDAPARAVQVAFGVLGA